MARTRYEKPRRIAPRLANGDSRVSFGAGWPKAIKDAVFMFAAEDGDSANWWCEKVVAHAIMRRMNREDKKFTLPEYVPQKADLEKPPGEQEQLLKDPSRVISFKKRA